MPRFAPVRTWAEAEEAAARIAFPAVLKPVAGSGSKGIFLLPDERHLRPAFEELSRITQAGADRIFHRDPGQLIYEEFMEGTEHSVEGFVHQGEVIVAGVTDKRTTEPFRLELAHVHPSALPADTLSAIDALTGVVIETLGLDDCAFHLECMSGPSGVKLVEVAARAGGDFIASHLVGLSTGVSFSENVVRVATGLAPVLGDRPVLYAGVHKIMAQEAGTLVRIDGVDEALRVPGVQHAVIDRAVGVEIRLPPTHFSSSVVGALIASGDSAESAWDTLETAVGAVRVEIAAPG
jgi:biotin carboxylase